MNIEKWLRTLLISNRQSCIACGQSKPVGMMLPSLCESCSSQVPWIVIPNCLRCGRAEACADCARAAEKSRAFALNRSAVVYNAVIREWLSKYKYGGEQRWTEPFSLMLEQAYRRMAVELSKFNRIKWSADLITWVPVSEQRLEERGFNQAEELARHLSKRLGLPAYDLLTRHVHTDKQSFKSRAERLHNLDGAFSLLPNLNPGAFKKWDSIGSGKRPGGSFPISLLLIDDIYTTGTTASVCADILKKLESVIERPVIIYSLTLTRS